MAIETHEFPNGLRLVVEPIGGVKSVGFTLLLPAGTAHEPAHQLGLGAVVHELLFRGAGDLDARAHGDALDLLGVHRATEVNTFNLRLGATFLGDRLTQALPLLTDMVRRPHLNEKDLDPAVQLALQQIESLEDEPQDKVMIELKRQHLGPTLGRSVLGEADHLRSLAIEHVRGYVSGRFVARGTIVAVAGDVCFAEVRDLLGRELGEWPGSAQDIPHTRPTAEIVRRHVHAESTQQHIGLAYETVGVAHADHIPQHVATAVLSGGMSGRLFTEVREKRGLCYSVYASYAPRRDAGTVFAYAGTTTQRAEETLDVLSSELVKMSAGVERAEFDRAIVGLKSRLVMQGESTSARARALASDVFLLGRPRSLEQVAAEVDAVTLEKVNAFVAHHSPKEFTTITVGPRPLHA